MIRTEDGVRCPLCGVRPSRRWTREAGWTIVRCSGCGLLITWPRPDDSVLAEAYADEHYYDARSMGEGAAAAWARRARAFLDTLGFSPQSVLDFGAGEGHFVSALREMGVAAEGIETSPSGRAAARQIHHLELHGEVRHDLDDQFQLITLFHSLEHVMDPVCTLTELKALAAPGGVVFVEVPHAGSVDMWRPSRRREILDLPIHLYHFVPTTLARVVERSGLRIVEIRLSNPDILEWALAAWARWRDVGSTVESSPPRGGSSGPAGARGAGVRSQWAGRVLPWIRHHFPGGKLQLLARRIP